MAIFSAPIAGGRVPGGDVIAAGLVVATHAITAARIDATGRAAWTRAVVPDVAWSADAELHAWPIAAGAVIAWRGPIGAKSARTASVLAPDGRLIDGPLDIGSLVCATSDGLAWSETLPGGASRVHLRTWPAAGVDGGPRDDLGPTMTEDFTLTCGDHRAYAVVEGDEATATRVFAVGPGASQAALVTIPPLTLGRDEERDLFAWAEGDELGLVRVAAGGGVQAADVHAGDIAPLGAKARVPADDDVASVDADAREVVLVTTHDESDSCPDGRGGASVHALRIPRNGGPATSLRLEKASCGKDVGPVWTNVLGRSIMVGWVERASRPGKASAPITGFAFRALDEGGTTAHVAQAADAIADAGCDETRCYAVALVRDPGSDGMRPEAIKMLAYP